MTLAATSDPTAAERQRRRRAKQKNRAELALVRQDWALFLQPDRLAQKAGCAERHLRRMAVKELVDNAADASSEVGVEQLDADTVRVADQGPGLYRDRVLELFAIDRPMTSSKLLRRPTRGAVGNGLRVVTGAVLGSEGALTVESQGRRYRLAVDRGTGQTRIADEAESEVRQGTTVTARFGPGLQADPHLLAWARIAAQLAGPTAKPMHSHPNWYTESAWRELVEAAAEHTAAKLLAHGFGIDAVEDGRLAGLLTLREAQQLAAAVPEPKLLPIPAAALEGRHAQEQGRLQEAPVLVQAWATASRVAPRASGSLEIELIVNRTTGPAKLVGYFADRKPVIEGCQLHYRFEGKPAAYRTTLAITSPYLPMVTDGKEPDLGPFADPICDTLAAAMRKAYAKVKPAGAAGMTIIEAGFACMADAYRKASAEGTLPANARQVYYAARPAILALTGKDRLDSNYFTQSILPRYLDEHPEETADWDIVYDARGHLTEPHTGQTVSLGTLDVRSYLAPCSDVDSDDNGLVRLRDGLWSGATTDRYRTALFIEKEGFEPLIAAAKIRERFDVAVLSTKGMSTTAARTLVERLSRDGVRILVAHDLDRAGKSILGTLADDTRRYRYEVAPKVVDIGLTLEQGRAMGLQEEENPIATGTDRSRLRATLRAHGATREEVRFLVDEERRIELNAMTSDVFIAWLEAQLVEHGAGKVVPDVAVLTAAWRRALARQQLAAAVRAAEAEALAAAETAQLPADFADRVRAAIEGTTGSWDRAVESLASRSRSDG